MPREKPDYRTTMEALEAAYPGQWLLSRSQIATFLGVSVKTVNRRYKFNPGRVTKANAAREICK